MSSENQELIDIANKIDDELFKRLLGNQSMTNDELEKLLLEERALYFKHKVLNR